MKTSKTVKNAYELTNLRMLEVKFLAKTNYNGARISISEPKRYNDDQAQRKLFSYCYKTGCIMNQAFDILKSNGWHIVTRSSTSDKYIFLCNNWANDFLEVSNLKNI